MTATGRPLAVVFSSAGRRVELINCFRADAARLGAALRAVAADAEPERSAACRGADAAYAVPRCADPGFVPRLLEICAAEAAALVVPTIDTELEALAARRADFARIGAEVAVSSPEVVRIARDKGETARFFAAAGVAAPRTAPWEELRRAPGDWRFPVVLKPAGGSASIGLRVLRSAAELAALREARADWLVQEMLAGREYTVNLYFDRSGMLRCAVPHRAGARFSLWLLEDALGRAAWKPSPAPYRALMDTLPGAPWYAYVADNPAKDFVAARALGWRTVQVRRPDGEHAGGEPHASHRADGVVSSLRELPGALGV